MKKLHTVNRFSRCSFNLTKSFLLTGFGCLHTMPRHATPRHVLPCFALLAAKSFLFDALTSLFNDSSFLLTSLSFASFFFFTFAKLEVFVRGEWVRKVRQGCRKTVDTESQLQYLRLFNFNFFNSNGNGLGCGASFPLIVLLRHSPPR